MPRSWSCAVLLLAVVSLSTLASARHGGRLFHGLRSPPVPRGVRPADAMWFKEQKLDHFSVSDQRTWSQRYFINDTLWNPSKGPVFLMLGGEGPADPDWLATDTEIMVNAARFGAFVIFLEHRFYGESHPTPNASLDNLVYLSSRQALMDAVTFKDYAVKHYNMTEANRWISFGGSYSGALSGWLRMLYPDTVVGAVATSGPVQAELNFYQYLEVVGESLATTEYGDQCVQAIQNATFSLDYMLSDKAQWPVVEKMFNVSPPLQDQDDVANLANTLLGYFAEIVQYNRDNLPGNNITMDTLCDLMTNTSLGVPLQRYAAVNEFFTNGESVDVNFTAEIEYMKQTSWNDSAVLECERQWIYQTCTEFGYYQTTDSAIQPFGDLVTLSSQLKTCSEVFNLSPTIVSAAVSATNKYYGGKDNIPKNATNIVFPNGSIDPWHALGVLSSPARSLMAIFITGTAHCANMYPARSEDPPGLTTARAIISANIQYWLM